ncbi:hypothetical protein LPUS_08954 [Lasallia pustulata]|uniref:Rhodopsin domain-containing protein n=1 Tax=Lasallia pustulata TaxID=136370 RepID=A0A1W5D6I6_9LECA|nr:hypothetical protein LPUS_08954 [Lasallia pustulata]
MGSSPVTTLIIVCSIFTSLMVLAVAIRVYTKARILRSLGNDDYTTLVAALSSLLLMSYEIFLIRHGFITHSWQISNTELSPRILQEFIGLAIVYGITTFFVKLSVLLLYLRIFRVNRTLRNLIYFIIVFLVLFYLAYVASYAAGEVMCADQRRPTASFCRTRSFSVVQSAINVAADFYVLCLPIAEVCKLHLKFRQKIGVIAIFMAGLLACVASVIRLAFIIRTRRDLDANSEVAQDSTYIAIEVNVGIICGCASTLPPFFRRYPLSLRHFGRGTRSAMPPRPRSGDGISLYPNRERSDNGNDVELKHQSIIRAGSPSSKITDAESGVVNAEDMVAAGGILKTVQYRIS